ncbi:MAG: hypothetical protein GY945_03645 [Rhodobacteraceae bacterium]|nr:hypothetical protein [Paracoccaceae bacterium]
MARDRRHDARPDDIAVDIILGKAGMNSTHFPAWMPAIKSAPFTAYSRFKRLPRAELVIRVLLLCIKQ